MYMYEMYNTHVQTDKMCGSPKISSRQTGASYLVTHGN